MAPYGFFMKAQLTWRPKMVIDEHNEDTYYDDWRTRKKEM